MSAQDIRVMQRKRSLERLLRRHGYHQDQRPDHREWSKGTPAYHLQVRLDQNNPAGFNGLDLAITTYLRWKPSTAGFERLLAFLKDFP